MEERYEIESLLGAGGVGQVYRAHDRRLDRRVALKLIRSDSDEEGNQLLAEAQAQARVVHDHVAEVFEAGRHGGKPCVVMRLVEGPTLEAVADELSPAEAAAIVARVARAVYAAHQTGLIHRDLKPGNVLLERRDDGWHPYVVDFGLATQLEAPGLTATGVVSGTPHYMAPEQIRGERSRSIDVWALGAILYRLVAGRPPHTGESGVEVLVNASSQDAAPVRRVAAAIPADLAAIVDRAVASAPEDRYPSAARLADDLDRFTRGAPVAARPLGPGRRLLRWARRHRVAATAAVTAIALVLGISAIAVRERLRASRQTEIGQELGAQARDITWWMRAAELAPRHDIRPERTEVRRRMRRLERRIDELGAVAEGPAAHALGRAHLALAEPAAARDQLERAMAAGYQPPAVSEALGIALSELYRDQATRAAWIDDPEFRQLRLDQLEAELAAPARQHLERALAASDDLLIRARQAFLDSDYPRAAELANRARTRRIWLAEAFLIEAAAMRAEADRLRREGDYEAAESAYAETDRVLAAAVEVAESSVNAYLDRCSLWTAVLDLRLYRTGTDPGAAFAAADDACRAAAAIAPDLATLWVRWSVVSRLRAFDALRRGEESDAHLDRAITRARRAVELAPEDGRGHRRLGLALRLRGRSEGRQGLDPRPTLRKALAALERAAQLEPDPVGWSNLGLAYSSLARQEASYGAAPDAEFDRAVAALEQAIDLAPDMAPLWVNLSEVLKNRGVYELDHGRDARPTLRRAVAAAEKAVALTPDYLTGWRNLGLARWYLGDALWHQAEDPLAVLEEARKAFAITQRLSPDSVLAWTDAANVSLLEARVLAAAGRSPMTTLTSASQSLDRAAQLNPELVWLHFLRGVVALERARWMLHSGKNPRPQLDRGRESFGRGLEIQASNPFALTDAARLELVAAAHDLASGRDPGPRLDRADALLARALARDPELATGLAAAGRSRLLRAQAAVARGGDPHDDIKAAEESLDEAAAADPRLARVAFDSARLELLRVRTNADRTTRRQAVDAARKAAARARQLQPSSAEAMALAATAEDAAAALGEDGAATRAAELLADALAADPHLRQRYGDARAPTPTPTRGPA